MSKTKSVIKPKNDRECRSANGYLSCWSLNQHGRIKVKTTAEQQEAKRIEREKKLKLYKAGTSRVFTKKENNEYDSEGLSITGELLAANPDFYSLWNYRRETFHQMKEKVSPEELQMNMEKELTFLERCLSVNPKSYGTWHHRGWVLQNMPEPDWKRELGLCTKFLEFDERNFHCWDYRRFIVSMSNVSAAEELTFTTNKIETNFSNYSSWHYRSKLLPMVHGDTQHPVGVQEQQLVNECLLAQNAFFTDPNDQSAWFYHKWLLGRVTRPLRIECVEVCRSKKTIIVGLSQPVKVHNGTELEVLVRADKLPVTWTSATQESYSHVWICNNLDELCDAAVDLDITISLKDTDTTTLHLETNQTRARWTRTYSPGTRFCQGLNAVTSDVLTQELSSLLQLHDLEPDNKWVLLTIISLMRALDPLKYEVQTMDYVEKLIAVDPMRTNYYRDIRSKFIIENVLETLPTDSTTLDLSNRQLTTLTHLDSMVTMETIKLSGNCLRELPDLAYLQCVQAMVLDGNRIHSCRNFRHLSSLEELSICDNNISTTEDLQALQSCPKLTRIHLKGNPVCQRKTDIVEFLMSKSHQKES